MTTKLKVINLLAGPGSGKSTTRAELFGKMKRLGIRVEETTEYAKDVTYDKNFDKLTDQLYILANQNRRLWRLQGQVDWVVNDSPLLLSHHYATPEYLPKTFRNLVFELWDQYENFNFYIHRVKPYQQYGRTQTEDQAREIDTKIIQMLVNHSIPYTHIQGDDKGHINIIKSLTETGALENVDTKLL